MQWSLTTSKMITAFNETVFKISASVRWLVNKSTPKDLSPYLQKRLKDEFGSRGISFTIWPDQAINKAAAEDAAIWCLKKRVKSRIACATFGTWTNTPYERTLHGSKALQIRKNHAGVIQATYVSIHGWPRARSWKMDSLTLRSIESPGPKTFLRRGSAYPLVCKSKKCISGKATTRRPGSRTSRVL